jgi:hypothetical protein
MAESKSKKDADLTATITPEANAKRPSLGVRLVPVENSDQPVMANYVQVNVVPGMAFVDFGFLEPGMLNALPRLAKQGGKLPETVNGKLAVRVAMGYEALASMHQQTARLLQSLSAAAVAAAKEKKAG